MGNIVGEGFAEFVREQVIQRQKIYGSVNRTNEQLSYLEARTGWVKLISSVNVEKNLRNLGYTGTQLAEQFVLFNGTTNESPTKGALETYQRYGIWNGEGLNNLQQNSVNQPYNYYAYGMGGTEFGSRPMPGIISANIKTETRGSIKTANINVRANNRYQFDVIDTLYMRLGFTMLLEWGNSSYFNNKGNYVSDNPHSLADAFLTLKYKTTGPNGREVVQDVNYDNLLDIIQSKREASNGNYDAVLGKVVNFSWTFTKEGAYDINIKIISLGDVIESLKTNILLPGSSTSNNVNDVKDKNAAPTPDMVIKEFANSNEIAKDFFKAQQSLIKANVLSNGTAFIGGQANDSTQSVDYFAQHYNGTKDVQYYVRFGRLLELIQQKIILSVNDPKIKLLKIDNDVSSNIIYIAPRQVSNDPRITVFNKEFKVESGNIYYFAGNCEPFIIQKGKNYYGQIMNSYFNMVWVLEKMESLKDGRGKTSLYDLLSALCQGWNESTGYFNQLEPTIDTETNTVKITDQLILPDKDIFLSEQTRPTTTAEFDIYGYYYNDRSGSYGVGASHAGFIRDFSFNTTIPPNLATMITVGSTNNGYVIGEDATALSRMNAGLKDRLKYDLKHEDTTQQEPTTSSLQTDYYTALDSFNRFAYGLSSYNLKNYPKWDVAAIESFKSQQAQFLEYDQAKQTIAARRTNPDAASPNSGFLPFDLSLTMDGLAGMKVYQKFTIDASFLPSNYPTSLEFIIKGISNKIESNQWTTTIDSMAVPKNPYGAEATQGTVAAASRTSSRGTQITPLDSKKSLVEKIIAIAKEYGITDKNRMTAILAVPYAETRLTNITESFNYTPDRFREIFGGYTRNRKLIRNFTNAELAPYLSSPEKTANLIYGPEGGNNGEGYKYRGRGFTQITFKNNYTAFQKLLPKYKITKNIVTNPDSITTDEDLSIRLLVIGKIEGSFGRKLSPNTDYINTPSNILLTQNGGSSKRLVPLSEYDAGRQWVNNTQWVQDLFNKYNLS
jgi:predicted chitinase